MSAPVPVWTPSDFLETLAAAYGHGVQVPAVVAAKTPVAEDDGTVR